MDASKSVKVSKGILKMKGYKSRPFRIKMLGGKQKFFATLEEAEEARLSDKLSIVESKQKETTNDSLREVRSTHVATFGNNLETERLIAADVVKKWSEIFTGRRAYVLNDGTVVDLILEVDVGVGRYVGIQLKTARAIRNNSCQFSHVNKYKDMPVLCWRRNAIHDDGWIFNGNDLSSFSSGMLSVTQGGRKNFAPIGMASMLRLVDEKKYKWRITDFESPTWEFRPMARGLFIERVTAEIWMRQYPEFKFPEIQNGPFDLVNSHTGETVQLKHANIQPRRTGAKVDIRECSGHNLDGKQLTQAYEYGSFDYLVIMILDWHSNCVYVWKIPSSALHSHKDGSYFRSVDASWPGRQSLRVHAPVTCDHATGGSPPLTGPGSQADTWTREYFEGIWQLPVRFSDAAEKTAEHFFRSARSGH
jgi:hypothetical protein